MAASSKPWLLLSAFVVLGVAAADQTQGLYRVGRQTLYWGAIHTLESVLRERAQNESNFCIKPQSVACLMKR